MARGSQRATSDAPAAPAAERLHRLALTAARWDAVVEAAPDAIISIDGGGRITLFNRSAERVFGYRAAEAIGRGVEILMPPPYRDEHEAYLRRYRETGVGSAIGQIRAVRGRRRSGETFPIELSVSEARLGTEVVYTAIIRDVSEREAMERALRRERDVVAAQYAVTRALAQSASLGEATPKVLRSVCMGVGWDFGELWLVDAVSGTLRWSGSWHVESLDAAAFLASSREASFPPGESLPGRVLRGGRPAWIGDIGADPGFVRAAAAAQAGLRGAFAFPIRSGDTVTGAMAFFSREAQEPDPELLRMLDAFGSQIGDFIERKRAEEAIRASEERFHAFMDNSPAVAFMKDAQGRYTYVNRPFERTFRLRAAEVTGRTDFDLWPAKTARRLRENDEAVLAADRPVELFESVPAPDGSPRSWLVFKFPVQGAGGQRLLAGMAVDVTERQRAEAKLRELQKLAQQRERLADIGAIVAKIVHDLGNPLAGVSMQAQLILRRARRDATQPLATVIKPAEQILAEAHRLDVLVKEFMEFSREQRLDLRRVELPGFLQAVADLWEPVAAARDIALALEVAADAGTITADVDKLRRVLDNLVKNAIEAIDRGPGRVCIRVAVPAPGRVRISVEDTGPGIPETVQVFRLFETTKADGTGLGLAVVKEIVHAHRGSVDFTCREPSGTTFHVELPRGGPSG